MLFTLQPTLRVVPERLKRRLSNKPKRILLTSVLTHEIVPQLGFLLSSVCRIWSKSRLPSTKAFTFLAFLSMKSTTAIASIPYVHLKVSPYYIFSPPPRLSLSVAPANITLTLNCHGNETRSSSLPLTRSSLASSMGFSATSDPLCTLTLSITFASITQAHKSLQPSGTPSRSIQCNGISSNSVRNGSPGTQFDLLSALNLQLNICDPILPSFIHDRAIVSVEKMLPELSLLNRGLDSVQSPLHTVQFILGTRIALTVSVQVFSCAAIKDELLPIPFFSTMVPAVSSAVGADVERFPILNSCTQATSYPSSELKGLQERAIRSPPSHPSDVQNQYEESNCSKAQNLSKQARFDKSLILEEGCSYRPSSLEKELPATLPLHIPCNNLVVEKGDENHPKTSFEYHVSASLLCKRSKFDNDHILQSDSSKNSNRFSNHHFCGQLAEESSDMFIETNCPAPARYLDSRDTEHDRSDSPRTSTTIDQNCKLNSLDLSTTENTHVSDATSKLGIDTVYSELPETFGFPRIPENHDAMKRSVSSRLSSAKTTRRTEDSPGAPVAMFQDKITESLNTSGFLRSTSEAILEVREAQNVFYYERDGMGGQTDNCNHAVSLASDFSVPELTKNVEEEPHSSILSTTEEISEQTPDALNKFGFSSKEVLSTTKLDFSAGNSISVSDCGTVSNATKRSKVGQSMLLQNIRSVKDDDSAHVVDKSTQEPTFQKGIKNVSEAVGLENQAGSNFDGLRSSERILESTEVGKNAFISLHHNDFHMASDQTQVLCSKNDVYESNSNDSEATAIEFCRGAAKTVSTAILTTPEAFQKIAPSDISKKQDHNHLTKTVKGEKLSDVNMASDGGDIGVTDRPESLHTERHPAERLSSLDIYIDDSSEHNSCCGRNTRNSIVMAKIDSREGILTVNNGQEADQALWREGSGSSRSTIDDGTDESDLSSNDYRPRHHSDIGGEDFLDETGDVEDDSSSDEDMTAGMVLAKRMREEYARKQQLSSIKSGSNDMEENLISDCSGIHAYGDDNDHFENRDEYSNEWRLLKSKSIKALRRSKSKRRGTDTLPSLTKRRSGRQHSTVYSDGIFQELPILMDLPTTRRLTFWMIDGPYEDDMDDDDDDSSCEEDLTDRTRLQGRPCQPRKRNAAQLPSFVLFSCTKPGPPARVGLISPLQKTVVFPCSDEENANISTPVDYISLAKPMGLKHLATEDSSGLMDSDLKFIDDPEYIEGEDEEFEDDPHDKVSREREAPREARRLRREKILIRKNVLESGDLELDEKSVQCHAQKSESLQTFETMPPVESNEKYPIHPGSNVFESDSKEKIHFGFENSAETYTVIEENNNSKDEEPMGNPDLVGNSSGEARHTFDSDQAVDKDVRHRQEFPSLSKRQRYVSRSSSRSSTEEWRNREEETGYEPVRGNLCRRTSYSDIVNCSIEDVVHRFRPNHFAFGENGALGEKDAHLDESDEERLFREAVCNQGGVTQKRLTKDELKIADLELDLENAERETMRMEDMLVKWVERLEGEKADILFKKQQLEEQLILQREKDEKDQMLRDNFFGGRNLPQNIKGEQNSDDVQLRHELVEERKKAEMLKRENERLLRVILCLKQELDSQMERQQRAIEMENMLKQTKEMLDCEREERHRLEKLIQDIDRGKTSQGSSASTSSCSPKKNRSGRLWWQ